MSSDVFMLFEEFCSDAELDPSDDISTEIYHEWLFDVREEDPNGYMWWFNGLKDGEKLALTRIDVKGQYLAIKTDLRFLESLDTSTFTPVALAKHNESIAFFNRYITEMDRFHLEFNWEYPAA